MASVVKGLPFSWPYFSSNNHVDETVFFFGGIHGRVDKIVDFQSFAPKCILGVPMSPWTSFILGSCPGY